MTDGQAGTGKSYTIAAIRQAYEIAGYRVVGLAPTNAVAQDMPVIMVFEDAHWIDPTSRELLDLTV